MPGRTEMLESLLDAAPGEIARRGKPALLAPDILSSSNHPAITALRQSLGKGTVMVRHIKNA